MPNEKQKAPEAPVPGRRALGLLLSQLGTHAALAFGRKIAGFPRVRHHLIERRIPAIAGLMIFFLMVGMGVVGFIDADYKTPVEEIEKILPWFDQGFEIVGISFDSDKKALENFVAMTISSRQFRKVNHSPSHSSDSPS